MQELFKRNTICACIIVYSTPRRVCVCVCGLSLPLFPALFLIVFIAVVFDSQ